LATALTDIRGAYDQAKSTCKRNLDAHPAKRKPIRCSASDTFGATLRRLLRRRQSRTVPDQYKAWRCNRMKICQCAGAEKFPTRSRRQQRDRAEPASRKLLYPR